MPRVIETALPFDNHRSTPLSMVGPFTKVTQQAGVDYLWLFDELSGWFPKSLWTAENSPAAPFLDVDSTYDPFVEAAFALAENPRANIRLSTDAIRSAPAELVRKVLTLASGTRGQVVVALGAGEQRQAKPFGYKRAEGLKRLEDLFVLIHKLWDEDEPFSYEGNHWHYRNATIGTTRPPKRPEFWALGGGPILLDIAARYADGFEAATPQAITTPEQFGETVQIMRKKVEEYGRDPDAFGFGIWNFCICHEDPDVIERALHNPVLKYFAGQNGRLDASAWADVGLTPVMPEGWHYAMHWLPFEQTPEEVANLVSRVPPEMVRHGFHVGTPDEIVALNRQFVEAGAHFVGHVDVTPLVIGPADAQDSMRRGIYVSAAVKQGCPVRAMPPASIDEVDDAWLSRSLGQDVRRTSEPEALSSFACKVYRLRLAGPAGTPEAVIVKLPIEGQVRSLIDALGIYRREVSFYNEVAPRAPLRTPKAYAAELASDSTDFVLVLEDLGTSTGGDQLTGLSLDEAGAVLDELARFHAWSWGQPVLDDLAETFPPIDSPAGRAMQDQWTQFFGLAWPMAQKLAGDALTVELTQFGDRFADYVPVFLEELSGPPVLTHGELRADNLLFDAEGRVHFVDFQNAQQECGPRELAYFLTQSLATETRQGNDEALVRRYWDGLVAAGVSDYPFEKAWRQYRLGVANQLMMIVVACMRHDAVDARGQHLLVEMLRRNLRSIQDNRSLALLPSLVT